jgi:hypothetical protein
MATWRLFFIGNCMKAQSRFVPETDIDFILKNARHFLTF